MTAVFTYLTMKRKTRMNPLFKIIMSKDRRYLRVRMVFLIDIVMSLLSSLVSLVLLMLLRPNFDPLPKEIIIWLGSALVASGFAFFLTKLYRAIIRYSTLREIGVLFTAAITKELILLGLFLVYSLFGFPIVELGWLLLLDFLITLSALVFERVSMIMVYNMVRERSRQERNSRQVWVYGVGDKSVSLVSRLRNSTHYHVTGFLIYGRELKGHLISGIPVYYFETKEDFNRLVAKHSIDGVIFPYIADARGEQDRLIAFCRDSSVRTYITPGIDEMTDGQSLTNYIRKVKIEDLLGRPEIKISMDEIVKEFNNKTVLVTGAAGSIGSELCRQLATIGVKKLILFDNAETPLHNIRLELEDKFPNLDFVPVIGDVRVSKRLDYVFRDYAPQVVFHAAAYKHVPLMEENPCEAVLVNVAGSRLVADKCVEYGVEKMVMISTDKAVNPTNIMGCTKRLAEIYVQALGLAIEKGEREGKTRFVTTRFGNVLGSNGSVIPRFREQIEHGGPVTVTHPEIQRFFMTIPEACRLVMEAATFATGTEIFVFDMGKPIKISSLAERMISLAGLKPGDDIRIEYTGLRPGEKLYEEVLATKENTVPTQHQRIFVAKVREYSYTKADKSLTDLKVMAQSVEIPEMVKLMKHVVPEFISKHSPFEIYDNPHPEEEKK